MARAFVAIVPPRDALDAVGKVAWRAAHRRPELVLPRFIGPRWTTRDQWHLTLQFLGSNVDLDAAADALASVQGVPATVRLGGVGGFPTDKRAEVVWLGVLEGARALAAIASSVGEAMVGVVGEPERREFRAHLTLARLARPADLRHAVEAARRTTIGRRWIADRVVLFESTAGAGGPRYRAHAEVELTAGS